MISIQEQIEFLEAYLENYFLQKESIDMFKSILSILQESEKREGKCNWRPYKYNAEMFIPDCHKDGDLWTFFDISVMNYCPCCGKEICWAREE